MASTGISALTGRTPKPLSEIQQLINESIQDLDNELQGINHAASNTSRLFQTSAHLKNLDPFQPGTRLC